MKTTFIKAALGAAALTGAAIASSPAAAQTSDFGATSDCPTLIAHTEVRRNIPRGLLMAIALTESGTGGNPSPYAMNIAGRTHFARSGQTFAEFSSDTAPQLSQRRSSPSAVAANLMAAKFKT